MLFWLTVCFPERAHSVQVFDKVIHLRLVFLEKALESRLRPTRHNVLIIFWGHE